MNEDQNKTPQAPEAQEAQPGAGLSRQRRQALVTYMAVLFVVAFLLVTLSLLIQNHNLKDSHESYATALEKAETLQDENRELLARAEKTRQAYDLLLSASAAQTAGERDAFAEDMAELAEMTDYLSQDALLIYSELCTKLPAGGK